MADRLNAMDSARIGTIHSLCSQILKTSFAEAGIDPDFSVLEEKQCSMVKARAIEEWLEFMTEKNNFHPLFQTFRIDEIRKILAGMLDRRLETKGIFERHLICNR
jgi:ATP-dependent exoDNAse (exonuclease V) beta subunit